MLTLYFIPFQPVLEEKKINLPGFDLLTFAGGRGWVGCPVVKKISVG